MEVDQQPCRDVKKAEMREQLCFIYRMQGFFTFTFNNHFTLYDQVGAEAAVQFDSLVDKRNRLLPLHP